VHEYRKLGFPQAIGCCQSMFFNKTKEERRGFLIEIQDVARTQNGCFLSPGAANVNAAEGCLLIDTSMPAFCSPAGSTSPFCSSDGVAVWMSSCVENRSGSRLGEQRLRLRVVRCL